MLVSSFGILFDEHQT